MVPAPDRRPRPEGHGPIQVGHGLAQGWEGHLRHLGSRLSRPGVGDRELAVRRLRLVGGSQVEGLLL